MGLVKLVHRIEEKFDRFEDAGLTVFLVLLCLLSFGLLPMVDLDGASRHLLSAAYTLLFILGAFLGDLGPRTRVFALLLGLFAVAVDWLQELAPSLLTDALSTGTSIVFMVLVCVALLRQVFRPGEINSHRLRGAVAVYLLAGFIFAMAFVLVEDFSPGSFLGVDTAARGAHFRDAIYLSFVTLTTLGFGDITPQGEIARTLVIVEAVFGQLFLAILVARLISMSVAGSRPPDP